jgi:hypothetical protein
MDTRANVAAARKRSMLLVVLVRLALLWCTA